jgi:hypothetical protein
MNRVIIFIVWCICISSCVKSKDQLREELVQRRIFWIFKKAYYRDRANELDFQRQNTNPSTRPSDSQLIYRALQDTAEFNLDRIDDSLFKLTGKSYRGG